MSINGEPGSDNLSKPPTLTSPEVFALRTDNDNEATEKKQTQIQLLFQNLPNMQLEKDIQIVGGKRQITFPLADTLQNIFESSASVVGAEKAQKEMVDISKKVITQKEAGESTEPWGANDTYTFLLQLESRNIIPPIKTLDKLGILPKSVLNIAKNALAGQKK